MTLPLSTWEMASLSQDAQSYRTTLWTPGVAPSPEGADLRNEKPEWCPHARLCQLQAAAVAAAHVQNSAVSGIKITDGWAAASAVPPGKAWATPEGQCQPPDVPSALAPPTRLAQPCASKRVAESPAARGPPVPPKPPRPLPHGTTTLIVRNIPASVKQDRILQEWRPDGTFNMLYLPWRPKGCAIINFLTPELALAFQQQWHGNYLSMTGHTKRLDIAAYASQSVWDILEQLSCEDFTELSKRDNLPALFMGTSRVNVEEVFRRMRLGKQKATPSFHNFQRISL